jgi:DNA-binding response OmpR family regulator
MHILMIEDDLALGRALQKALQAEGFSSQWLRRATDAPATLKSAFADCVLLDLSLPDGTGFDLLRRWRDAGEAVPIIIVTARSALEERLAGLDGGADDFLVKPFVAAELISRIRAVMRRSAQQASEVWTFGALQIEPRRQEARLEGRVVELSRREFRLLLELAREPGGVHSKEELAHRLEPLGDPVDFGTLEIHVFNLRRKLGPQWVRTVRGVGYMLTP